MMKTESIEKLRFVGRKLKVISGAFRKNLPELSKLLDECTKELFDIELMEVIDAIVQEDDANN